MKVEAHQRYYLKDGTLVPGVTTILQVLNKPALVKWANKMGLQGIDTSKYKDKMAEIGTIAHYLIECDVKGEKPILDDYAPADIDKAENSLLSFYEWQKNHKLEVIFSEKQLVSETYRYGGTVDCYAKLDGKYTLIDFKTSNAIYPEMIIQLSAYKNLLEEAGHKVEEVRILRIGRDETEGFEERKETNLEKHFELFLHCLAIYNLKKELKISER